MEEKRRRGRPRKDDSGDMIENNQSKNNSSVTELEIDKTDFDFYEPQNFDSPSVEQYNPLAETPIKREYSSPKIQEGIMGDIVEPQFHQPTISTSSPPPPNSSGNQNNSARPQGQSPISNPNPSVNQLDDADKKLACEQMVDAALDIYETLWGLGGRFAQVSEEKLQELVNDGSIDPNRRIPVEDTSVSIFEFFQNYNNQVSEASKVDKDFKKKVRPPMIRVFTKHGWGLTDEQFLLIAFGKDAVMRTMTLYQMNKSIKGLINTLSEENSEREKPKSKSTPPPKPPKPKPSQKSEIIDPKDIEVVGEEDDYDFEIDDTPPTPIIERNQDGVEKLKINFEDNPLRAKVDREPPAPKVEETFIKGGEIKDDLSI